MTTGKRNRLKGKRMEYKLRDTLREYGYEAHRVPSSGAAHGFPGDVSFKDAKNPMRLAELKSRKKGFEKVYEFLYSFVNRGIIREHSLDRIKIEYNMKYGGQVTIALNPRVLFEDSATVMANETEDMTRKFLILERWVEKSDMLVLHTDRHPFLYLRYKDEEP